MIRKLRVAWILALALVAGPALALGLGQIEVKSQRDQPLLAEIPIISSDPGELEQLQARLASPDTFARIGLPPPQGLVSDLQFMIALDGQGRPVIRVTSVAPVQQPLLTFLIEVDWGQGRLVREYSALVDAPRTVSAPAQPVIQAPVVAPPSTILRPAEVTAAEPPPPPATASVAPTEVPPPPAAEIAPAPPLEPEPQPTAVAPSPVAPLPAAPEPAAVAPAPAVAQSSEPGEYGPVQRGETLGLIAGSLGGSGYSLDQTMLALLRANPDAFIDGNVNLVRQGAVLRVPAAGEIASLGADDAAVMVREQIAQWREARQPAPQPAAVAGAAATTPAPRADRAAAASNAPRVADARLEIVPPSASSGRRAGTRSGINAGGEGDMLRQELQQTEETLAARTSEVEELKARVADLEKLQQQQQQLITLKDSELAAAQQRLAASNRAAETAPGNPASAAPAERAASDGSAPAWVWGGVVLLLLALVLGWVLRRRKPPASPTRAFDTDAMAASIPTLDPAAASTRAAAPAAAFADAIPERPTFVDIAPKPVAEPASSTPPAWNAGAAIMPTWHAAKADAAPATDEPAPADAGTPGQERIELARAYIDLGDVDTARSLLQEVVAGGDVGARGEATRLLRELA